jgi:hypothetical protein
MPAGLQVWDAAGNLVVDITTRLSRFLGSVNSGTSGGSISVPDLAQGTPFYFVIISGGAVPVGSFGPEVTFSGTNNTTMSWSFASGRTPLAATIYYGVF